MDENFAYWSTLFQRAGEWFSSSLALGTDVVADITDRLSSDMPCLHNRARCHLLSYFQPTWWAHSPQVHWIETWLFFTTRILMYPLHLASCEIHELNTIPLFILGSNTMLFSLFKPLFQLLSSHRMIAYPFETLVPSYIALNKFVGIQLVGYLMCFPLSSPTDAQLCGDAFFWSFFSFVVFIGWWRSRRKDDNLIMVTWNREMKTSKKGINLFERAAKTKKTR